MIYIFRIAQTIPVIFVEYLHNFSMNTFVLLDCVSFSLNLVMFLLLLFWAAVASYVCFFFDFHVYLAILFT